MTDNEIIKALECLTGKEIACAECEYKKRFTFGKCRQQVAVDALNLVNRQKAEIEHWRSEAYKYQKFWSNSYNKQELDDVREKAIEEFAEQLWDRLVEEAEVSYECVDVFDKNKTADIISDLEKEMSKSEEK